MSENFTSFQVLTFDCYGTLIDWEKGLWDAFQPILSRNSRTDLTKGSVLHQFAMLESSQQSVSPGMLYTDVLRTVHAQFAIDNQLITTQEMDQRFGRSVQHWPTFSDSVEALRALQSKYKLVILSNIDRESFSATNRKVGVRFDAIYTAEDIGTYKPDAATFEYLLVHLKEDLGMEKRDILHVAQSLYHDHIPARKAGLANVWIDRQKLSQGGKDWKGGNWGATAMVNEIPEFNFLFYSMKEFAQAVMMFNGSIEEGRQ